MEKREKTVWYVEAKEWEDDDSANSGSAVAVSLKSPAEKRFKNYLLTCAHVVRAESSDGQKGYGPALGLIKVWRPGGAYTPEQALTARIVQNLDFSPDEVEPDARSDAANDWVLLEVDDHAFSNSGESISEWAEPTIGPVPAPVIIFGYISGSSGFQHGVAEPTPVGDFTVTDIDQGVLEIRARGGQTRGGMSGGPVFGPDDEFWGIHRSYTDQHLLYRSVSASHIKRSLHNSRWFTDANQRFPGSGVITTPARQPEIKRDPLPTFVVSVGPQCDDGNMLVSIENEDDVKPVLIDLNPLRVEVAKLFRDWALRGRVKEEEKVQLLGDILYRALFSQAINARFTEKRKRNSDRLLVSLRFEKGADPELVQLPWEYMFNTSNQLDTYFATDAKMTFSRCTQPVFEPSAPRTSLSVLVINARPQGDEAAKTREVISKICTELENIKVQTENIYLDVDYDEVDSLNTLEQKLESKKYDIVHYVGVGRLNERNDELMLGEDGGFVDVSTLAETLSAVNSPRVVILQQCVAVGESVAADFGNMGPDLLDLDLEAVIAFQDPMEEDYAIKFNQILYTELDEGEPIQVAIQECRRKLRYLKKSAKMARSFVSPALFTKGPKELRLIDKQIRKRTHG